jgi:transcriptional regulator with XRE-family HTH domain
MSVAVEMAPEASSAPSIPIGRVIAQWLAERGSTVARLAYGTGVPPADLEALTTGEPVLLNAAAIGSIANKLGVHPDRLREFRLAVVLESLPFHPLQLDRLFREALSPIERELIVNAVFSDKSFGPTVWQLLHRHEMTQQELAESIGIAQPTLSRMMNGHELVSSEIIEPIAQALDVPPETFEEYRLELLADWLRSRPDRIDELFQELSWSPTFEEYRAWVPRPMRSPREVSPRELIESLLDIVSREGPVMGARVYALRLAASGIEETREVRSLLNRASAAAARVGLIIDENEEGGQTQKYRILRLPDQPPMIRRTLGGRELWQVPPRELESVVQATPAWKRGESVAAIQDAVKAAYGLSGVSARDAEHVNRAIVRCREGGSH